MCGNLMCSSVVMSYVPSLGKNDTLATVMITENVIKSLISFKKITDPQAFVTHFLGFSSLYFDPHHLITFS